eukprot:scaffold3930_cov242-Prasinococcus_capsulatus_cf.AAC.1
MTITKDIVMSLHTGLAGCQRSRDYRGFIPGYGEWTACQLGNAKCLVQVRSHCHQRADPIGTECDRGLRADKTQSLLPVLA